LQINSRFNGNPSSGGVDATASIWREALLRGADGGRSPRKPDRAQPSRKVVAVSVHPVCGAKVGFA
jgi:hypothetical protein